MNNLEKNVLRWLPLFGPVPIAWTVYHATTTLMSWPIPVAIAGAIFIEGIGFSSINLAVRMSQFNARLWEKERGQYTAPTLQALAAVALYALTALLLAVLLEVFSWLRVWSPASFILMSLTGGYLWALYRDQEQREIDHTEKREKTRQTRSKPRSKGEQVAGATSKQGSKVTGKLQVQGSKLARKQSKQVEQVARKPVTDESLLAIWQQDPRATDNQVAKQFGVSRQAIQGRRSRLIERGDIRMTEAGAVEVVGVPIGIYKQG